jgi:outer membrane protein assembly factor BamB
MVLLTRGNRTVKACLRYLVAAGCIVALWSAVARADNWPQWRGPSHDGVSKETGIATEWSADKNVVWKVDLPGMGSSTPAIWGKHIFLTSQEGNDLVLVCISTEGKELWKRKLATGNRTYRRDEGNDASASPSTDGKHVYAFVGPGEFVCFDFEGKEIWRFNAQKRYGKFDIQFGLHSTPVLHGDRLYMQLIHSGGAWVIAIDKANGKDVWKVARPSDGTDECEHSYASAVLWTKGKDAYLIAHGNDYATAHSLKDGAEIWRVGDLNPKGRYNPTLRFVASPVATPDLIVIPSAKNGPVVGIKPDAKGRVKPGSSSELWRRPRETPDVPSPLVHGGLVYLGGEWGSLICLDAKTGKEHYFIKRVHTRVRHRASPVYADGKVFLTARDGTVNVVKAGPTYKLLATNKLPDQVTASPAISNGRIYIRGWKALYAIEPAK